MDYQHTIFGKEIPDSPLPLVKPPKQEKIKRIYEDNDFVIDLFPGKEPMIRVSIFEDNHFKDEVFIRRNDYLDFEYTGKV